MQIEDEESWDIGEANGFVGIGWAKINPTKYSKEDKELLIEEYKRKYKESPNKDEIGTMLRFVNDIIEGEDFVILPTFPENLGEYYLIGKVKTRAYYEKIPKDGAYERTRRKVEWLNDVPRELLSESFRHSLNAHQTVFNIDKHRREIIPYLP
ncbi:MAG: hypothetical protein HF975_15055 [ANME-2 cluster archaeon]|nr:hypothetical protein [ANME-2 cluster archaeon]MBC2748288.1 hypothetical protein [ANME-2 cluster archaeon]